jgi:hypothetical protein
VARLSFPLVTARRTTTILGAAAVLAGAFALAPTTAGGQTAPCEEPYSPVAFAEVYPAQDALPAVPGTVVTSEPARLDAPDTDGDGQGDALVALTAVGGGTPDVTGVPDIDGDGRDELAVVITEGPDLGTYLVPGTVAPGSTAVPDAGIKIFNAQADVFLAPDDTDRLLVVERITVAPDIPSITNMLDAAPTLALGAGADVSSDAPEAQYDGRLWRYADLGGSLALVMIQTVIVDGDRTLTIVVAEGDGDVIELTSEPHPFFSNDPGPLGPLEVIVGSEGTFVRLSQSSRSGAADYLWSLDDPCTPYSGPAGATPTPTTPTAPPAAPVAAEAAFTG